MAPTENPRKPWSEFVLIRSNASVAPQAHAVNPDDLVNMATYRDNKDALDVFVVYAHDSYVFDENGKPKKVDKAAHDNTPRLGKVNKFGKSYKDDAQLWLHKDMADIVVDAAEFMHAQYGWRSTLYDGLRTVNGAYNMYRNAAQSDLDEGLLAPPGLSAHNKGMAADLTMFDKNGKLVDIGGNFDHLDMKTNSRNNTTLSPDIIANRRQREIAFQHAALSRGRLFAPLRSEFWDERFPENMADHWRVLESLCRCLGKTLLTVEDENNRISPAGSPAREAFRTKWEAMDYDQFKNKWAELFDDATLRSTLKLDASIMLPPDRSTVIYHGDFHPLYDRDLPPTKQITDNALDMTLPNQATPYSGQKF